MRISSFDLSWFAQWPVSRTALDEGSIPGLTNGVGPDGKPSYNISTPRRVEACFHPNRLTQCRHWSNISGGLFFTVLEELSAP